MIKFFMILKIIIKLIFCTLLSIFFIVSIFIELLVAGPCFDIIIVAFFSIIFVCLTWIISFIKFKKLNLLIKTVIFILMFCFEIALSGILPNLKIGWEKDMCYDDGICKEGIINMQDNKGNYIPITKENCINNGYKWYEENKSCDLRKKQ